MPGDLPVGATVVIPAAELSWRFSRSGGPGGQAVNTSDTRVELSYDIGRTTALEPALRARALDRLAGRLVDGVLTVSASEYRSQLRNREAAERRLVEILTEVMAPPRRPRRPTQPSRAARARRVEQKKRRSDVKRLRRRPPL